MADYERWWVEGYPMRSYLMGTDLRWWIDGWPSPAMDLEVRAAYPGPAALGVAYGPVSATP